jgi:hypothetical protein
VISSIIQTPSEIQKIATELMVSATYEILLLFPTTNSFCRAEYSGMLNSVWEASQRGVIVKMLIQGIEENDKLREIVQKVIRQGTCQLAYSILPNP